MRWSGSCLVPLLPCQAAVWVTVLTAALCWRWDTGNRAAGKTSFCVIDVFSSLLTAVRNIFAYCN